MRKEKPQFIIAGTGSGVGKTSISLGITAALVRRKLSVQTFKTGPDYLDPTYLKLASGNTCYNLDSWMCDFDYLTKLYHRRSNSTDVSVVEGVMGLFDGADPCTIEGSTAEIAKVLNLPVILLVNAHGCARSIAATVKGFCELEKNVEIAGVIANYVGSERHVEWLRLALDGAGLPPLIGGIPRDSLPSIPSRHLGLKTAGSTSINDNFLDEIASACEEYIEIDTLLDICQKPVNYHLEDRASHSDCSVKIAVADDEAFHFTYADNLRLLEENGAEICFFSPLNDDALPHDVDGVYLPGGYPEIFAEKLSDNKTMIDSVKSFADMDKPIYAECGGLMYLGESITNCDDESFSLCGVIPIQTRLLTKRKMLGYTEVTLQEDCLLGVKGDVMRGHEFHYSEITVNNADAWQQPYSVTRRRRSEPVLQGFSRGNILASYIHLHWGSTPHVPVNFINKCIGVKK